jgi:hypothetical protein
MPADESAAAHERDRAIEIALADLVLGPERDLDDPAAFRKWVSEQPLHPDDAAALAAQDPKRLAVYRTLPRFSMRGAVALAIPRSIARLGDAFDTYWDRFLSERGPRSHYLRDVTTELLDFCEPLWREDNELPRYMTDLARHESLRVIITAHPTRTRSRTHAGATEPAAGGLELDRGVRFIEAVRVVHYEFAVQELSDDEDDRSEPREEATTLFVYRDPDHRVRYLKLSPLAGAIVQGLLSGQTLGDAVTGSCDQARQDVTETVLGGVAEVLGDLANRGVILGPRA